MQYKWRDGGDCANESVMPIQRILNPTEEEKKQLKAVVDDFPIFEWEVVLNNNKKE
jgi:hypothetical protein